MDSIYGIRCPQGKRKPTSTLVCSPTEWRTQREGEKEEKDSRGWLKASIHGGMEENKTGMNLSGGAGAMLLTACWNALNSCLFNYANIHMQMTTVRNTMLSQLGDRLTRVGFRKRPDYCPAIRLQANSFWPVIIVMRHQQGGLTRRLRGDVLFACDCTCGRLWTCVFTCYIYWFPSALLLLVQLLRS